MCFAFDKCDLMVTVSLRHCSAPHSASEPSSQAAEASRGPDLVPAGSVQTAVMHTHTRRSYSHELFSEASRLNLQ